MQLSVVIPVYNVSPYIETCLTSIFKQTFKENFEVLLVDDCGTDDSVEIARRLIDASSPVNQSYKILHHEKNRGLSAARNTGLLAADGKYVYFLDSDDLLSADCFEVLIGLADKHRDAQMIVGQFDEFVEGGEYHSSKWPQYAGIYKADVIGAYVNLKIPATATNKIVDRDFLIQNKLFFEEGLIHEDYLWSFQLACLLKCAVVSDKVTYHYLQRGGSIQHGYDFIKHQLNYARASALQTKFLFVHELQNDVRIFIYIDKFRRNIVGDVSATGDEDAVNKILELFHQSPYWSAFNLLKLKATPKEVLRRLLKPNWK